MCNPLFYICLCTLGADSAPAAAPLGDPRLTAPQPAVAPVSWELKFRYHDPQRVSVVLPGQDRPAVYWYMLYTVENPTDQEVDFYPQFDLVTDTLQVVRSEIGVSPEAFKAIQRREHDPLLVPHRQVIGPLLRGQDRARHSVAIWRDFDPKAKSFVIYVSGLSGEVTRWKNPAFDRARPEDDTNPQYFTLRKALAIPYAFPGAEATRAQAVPERVTRAQHWIMR